MADRCAVSGKPTPSPDIPSVAYISSDYHSIRICVTLCSYLVMYLGSFLHSKDHFVQSCSSMATHDPVQICLPTYSSKLDAKK